MMIKNLIVDAIYSNLEKNIKYSKFNNDCLGMVFKVLKDANILFDIPNLSKYNIHKVNNRLSVLKAELYDNINPYYGVDIIKYTNYNLLDTGDVLLFGKKKINHAGFYLKGENKTFDELAHAVEDKGFIKTRLITIRYKILYIIRFFEF